VGLALIAGFTANLAAGAAELPLPPQFVWPPLDKGFAWRPFDKTPSTYTGDFGLRFWYGRSSTAKNLYDPSGTIMVSRLTYDNLSIFAAHLLRISNAFGDFNGPIPEDGRGWGYQFEGFMQYRVTEALSVGFGGRYWHMQTHGLTHFEGHVNGVAALPQPVEWKVNNFGAFVQLSLKFGPYYVIDVH